MKRKQILTLLLSASMFLSSTFGTIAWAEEEKEKSSEEISQTLMLTEDTDPETSTKTENIITDKNGEESGTTEDSEQKAESEEPQALEEE